MTRSVVSRVPPASSVIEESEGPHIVRSIDRCTITHVFAVQEHANYDILIGRRFYPFDGETQVNRCIFVGRDALELRNLVLEIFCRDDRHGLWDSIGDRL